MRNTGYSRHGSQYGKMLERNNEINQIVEALIYYSCTTLVMTVFSIDMIHFVDNGCSLPDEQLINHLSLDIGLVAADVLLELEELSSELDLGLEEILGIKIVGGGVAGVLLDVKADGGAGGASAGETDDDTAAGGEAGVQALVGGNRAIEVSVGEVAGLGHLAAYYIVSKIGTLE